MAENSVKNKVEGFDIFVRGKIKLPDKRFKIHHVSNPASLLNISKENQFSKKVFVSIKIRFWNSGYCFQTLKPYGALENVLCRKKITCASLNPIYFEREQKAFLNCQGAVSVTSAIFRSWGKILIKIKIGRKH